MSNLLCTGASFVPLDNNSMHVKLASLMLEMQSIFEIVHSYLDDQMISVYI